MVLTCDEVGFSIFIQAFAQCAVVDDPAQMFQMEIKC